MTLLAALRSLGVLIGDPSVDSARQQAGEVLLPELAKLALGLGFPRDLLDDAVADTFCRLMTGGNRGAAALACDSDVRVRGFLRECVRNALLDELRRRKRLAPLDQDLLDSVHKAQHPSPEEEASALQEVELRRSAEAEFYERIVPTVASGLRTSASYELLLAVGHMRALASGETDFTAVVLEATGRHDGQAQSAVHQRHSRTRRRLMDYIERLEVAGETSPDRIRVFRWCVSRLQRRAS